MKSTNRLSHPIRFIALVTVIWWAMLLVADRVPKIDLWIGGGIALACGAAAFIMIAGTRQWTTRGLGLLGLMLAIVLLYLPLPLREVGIMGTSPEWFIHLRRAILIVSGPFILIGIWQWFQEGDGDV